MLMKSNEGFTLIEILIALVILSIALTAIIKATADNINHTAYLQQKMISLWVAKEVINETRAQLLILPDQPDKLEKNMNMLGKKWRYQAYLKKTANAHIKEIQVDVFEENKKEKIIHLMGYLYAPY